VKDPATIRSINVSQKTSTNLRSGTTILVYSHARMIHALGLLLLVLPDAYLPRHYYIPGVPSFNSTCYSTLLYATLRYSTLLYATLRYSTLLYATLRYSTLLYATLRYSTLLYATSSKLYEPAYSNHVDTLVILAG
jgi:hypothetical protein